MEINADQKDALTELIHIGVGHAASTLNCLIKHKVRLTVPSIELQHIQDIKNSQVVDEDVSSVSMAFHGDFTGNTSLMFPVDSAQTLVAVLTGEAPDSTALDDSRSGTLSEVGNIFLNGVMGSLSNMLSSTLDYAVPVYQEASLTTILGHRKSEAVLMARANFYIDELCIEGNILLFFEIESFRALMQAIDREMMA